MKLYIIGAGNVGGFIAHQINDFGLYQIEGFIDDDDRKHGLPFCGFNVVGNVSFLENIKESIAVVIAIANPIVKQYIYNKIKGFENITFPNFIHPTAWFGNKVSLGEGVIVYPGVSVNYETNIQNFTILNMNCAIGHNVDLGRFVTLSPGVNLGGFTCIQEETFIGIGASTIQGKKIGKNVTVGGMSIIINDVPDYAVVVGNPGKIIKYTNQ